MFQITVSVRDKGLPTSRSSPSNAVVTVNILRNQNPPIFFNTTFSAQIPETVPAGTSVAAVTASDADANVSTPCRGLAPCRCCRLLCLVAIVLSCTFRCTLLSSLCAPRSFLTVNLHG